MHRWNDLAWKIPIPATEKLVLIYLLDQADPKGRAWPSLTDIAQDTGLARRTVIYALKRLRERGLVSWASVPGRGNVYQLNLEGLEALAQSEEG